MAYTWCLEVSTSIVHYLFILFNFMLIWFFLSISFLLIIGHDCSIRLWNLESKTCIQEFTAHRKKFEESIHDVAFHPSKCYIASAGADALAKVFVWQNASSSPSSSLQIINCTKEIQKTRARINPSCPFVLLKEHRGHLLKYSFAIRILFSKTKVCSGCCKLSWIYEPENCFKFPPK